MLKAIVIDDNKQAAHSLCDMLELLEIQAEPLIGSRQALIALKSSEVDLIFLDIRMPGLSGFEVLSYIQREPKLVSIPVIIVTSDDQLETAQRVYQLGAKSIIIKPITVETLEETIAQIPLNNS